VLTFGFTGLAVWRIPALMTYRDDQVAPVGKEVEGLEMKVLQAAE
jgi:hypothetical protein